MGDRKPYIAAAARTFAAGLARMERMTPRAAAEAAHYAGGPSVDDLERLIESERQHALPRAA